MLESRWRDALFVKERLIGDRTEQLKKEHLPKRRGPRGVNPKTYVVDTKGCRYVKIP
jgi:hypothetical protein